MTVPLTPEPRTILFCGADENLRDFVRGTFAERGFAFVSASDPGETIGAIDRGGIDALVVDAKLDGAYGLISSVRAGSRTTLPIVALAAHHEIDAVLDLGADDCCVAPLHPRLLARRVERLVSRKEPASSLAQLARVDGFLSHVSERLARAGEGQLSAMFVVALDREDVLCAELTLRDAHDTAEAAALALREVLRSRDSGGRRGEPNIALLDSNRVAVHLDGFERPLDAYRIAQRIQERLEPKIEVNGANCGVLTSVGIALYPDDGRSAAQLLDAALRAVSEARNEPCGSLRFAGPSTNMAVLSRLALESDLRVALEHGELLVYYQPRVSVGTGMVIGVEALVRWKHPRLGMVSPAQFIPVAEETGLIKDIGSFVLREACLQSRRWRDQGLPPITVAVNLSAIQVRDPLLRDEIAAALNAARLPADGLELELTESMLLDKAEAIGVMLRAIKELGVRLAIDDFGTGYSNLGYIRRFPIDTLKIDQSFVREVMTSSEDAALTTSIVLMAKSLGLSCVAEGVETKSQLAFLAAIECDEVQGFLFSRPLPPDDVGPLISMGFSASVAA